MRIAKVLLGVLVLVVVATGCQSPADPVASGLPADATVQYKFNDSSVPPAYHRSFELTVTARQARLVVDSYGDILADEVRDEVSDAWAKLDQSYAQLAAVTVVEPAGGCVGGTSRSLEITQGEEVIKEIFIDDCAEVNDVATAALANWIAPAQQLFPAIDVLAPS
ncbi:MAG: hypothetical protein O2943_01885 [Actinomycetota bacterium]|nr:hypothetical protein [Actinomycetota bacterium]